MSELEASCKANIELLKDLNKSSKKSFYGLGITELLRSITTKDPNFLLPFPFSIADFLTNLQIDCDTCTNKEEIMNYLDKQISLFLTAELFQEYLKDQINFELEQTKKDYELILSVIPNCKPRGEHVYFIRSSQGYIKIGRSSNPKKRLKQLSQKTNPHDNKSESFELLAIIPNGGRQKEKELHLKFLKYHKTGEWFKEAKEILDYIKTQTVEEIF